MLFVAIPADMNKWSQSDVLNVIAAGNAASHVVAYSAQLKLLNVQHTLAAQGMRLMFITLCLCDYCLGSG